MLHGSGCETKQYTIKGHGSKGQKLGLQSRLFSCNLTKCYFQVSSIFNSVIGNLLIRVSMCHVREPKQFLLGSVFASFLSLISGKWQAVALKFWDIFNIISQQAHILASKQHRDNCFKIVLFWKPQLNSHVQVVIGSMRAAP